MRPALLALTLAFALALAVPAQAEARTAHHTRSCPSAIDINSPAAQMRALFKDCLIGFGMNAGATLVGGIISQLAARTIAGGMIAAGAGGCINRLVP
jgi:hypothetical protein